MVDHAHDKYVQQADYILLTCSNGVIISNSINFSYR